MRHLDHLRTTTTPTRKPHHPSSIIVSSAACIARSTPKGGIISCREQGSRAMQRRASTGEVLRNQLFISACFQLHGGVAHYGIGPRAHVASLCAS